jgi:predicted ATPase
VGDAQAVLTKTGERVYESEIWRLKGELLLNAEIDDHDVVKEAEECFLKAIEVARRQEGKSWELRATISLCRLLQKLGKIEDGRRSLVDTYRWFTEGFDTSDLREARAMLEALS